MLIVHGRRYGFELNVGDAPGASRSMRIALADLRLEHLWIVFPGREEYELDERISVLQLIEIPEFVRQDLAVRS